MWGCMHDELCPDLSQLQTSKERKRFKEQTQRTAPRGTSVVIDESKTGQKFLFAAVNWNPQAFFCLNIILTEYYILLEQINSKLLFFYPARDLSNVKTSKVCGWQQVEFPV